MSTTELAAEFCLQLFISTLWTGALGTGARLGSRYLSDHSPWNSTPEVFSVATGTLDERVNTLKMTSNVQSEWLTVAEAAQHLRIKPRTLLLWVRQGKVKAFALSGTKRRVWRFRQADLDAALLESTVLTSTSPSVGPAERMDQ